jgi:hypothetical protein
MLGRLSIVVPKNDFGEKDSGFFRVKQGKEWQGSAAVSSYPIARSNRIAR